MENLELLIEALEFIEKNLRYPKDYGHTYLCIRLKI